MVKTSALRGFQEDMAIVRSLLHHCQVGKMIQGIFFTTV
jgi:hypothetical protein